MIKSCKRKFKINFITKCVIIMRSCSVQNFISLQIRAGACMYGSRKLIKKFQGLRVDIVSSIKIYVIFEKCLQWKFHIVSIIRLRTTILLVILFLLFSKYRENLIFFVFVKHIFLFFFWWGKKSLNLILASKMLRQLFSSKQFDERFVNILKISKGVAYSLIRIKVCIRQICLPKAYMVSKPQWN